MFHINRTEFDFIEDTLKRYDIGEYIIAFEKAVVNTKTIEHFHIVFEGTIKIYNNFSKVLKEKYKLNGSAKKGQTRQYGKIKNIKDIEKLKSYTLKDGDFRTNMDDEVIHSLVQNSYQKSSATAAQENQTVIDTLLAGYELLELTEVGTEPKKCWTHLIEINSRKYLRLRIIELLLELKVKTLNKSRINKIAIDYLMQANEKGLTNNKKVQTIYDLLF